MILSQPHLPKSDTVTDESTVTTLSQSINSSEIAVDEMGLTKDIQDIKTIVPGSESQGTSILENKRGSKDLIFSKLSLEK